MKKILVMMLAVVLCMAMLTGCGSNTGNTEVIGSSDAVEENTESSIENASVGTETDMTDSENVTASEEESEITEETVIFSADEVMAYIDTLITQYTYNDPEHIKALVIAANLDYISEEDLNTILTTYGYTMEDLATLYEECLMDAMYSFVDTHNYYYGINNSVSSSKEYANRITLASVMLNEEDRIIASEVDENLLGGCHNDSDCFTIIHEFCSTTPNNNAEKVMSSFAYTVGVSGDSSRYNPYKDMAEEIMNYIDTLIAEYSYNNPEHIKALVIAANLDYVSEKDLNIILTTYGYSIEELAILYDECILDNAVALQTSLKYSQGEIDSLSEKETYANRITIKAIMLNNSDKETAKWYDKILNNRSQNIDEGDFYQIFTKMFENSDGGIGSAERTMYTYTNGVYENDLKYTEYLDNPYIYYLNK